VGEGELGCDRWREVRGSWERGCGEREACGARELGDGHRCLLGDWILHHHHHHHRECASAARESEKSCDDGDGEERGGGCPKPSRYPNVTSSTGCRLLRF
jgi:hypothetical protein